MEYKFVFSIDMGFLPVSISMSAIINLFLKFKFSVKTIFIKVSINILFVSLRWHVKFLYSIFKDFVKMSPKSFIPLKTWILFAFDCFLTQESCVLKLIYQPSNIVTIRWFFSWTCLWTTINKLLLIGWSHFD